MEEKVSRNTEIALVQDGGGSAGRSSAFSTSSSQKSQLLGPDFYPGSAVMLMPLPVPAVEEEAPVVLKYKKGEKVGKGGKAVKAAASNFHEVLEYNEQFYAQVAAVAVSLPADAIQEGIRKTILTYRTERKTKADWNAERVRDFRVTKDTGSKPKTEDVFDQMELHGGAADYSAMMPATDPIPYLQNYDYETFTDTLRHMNRKHANFASIRILDLCGQLIGDSKLSDLCYQLRRCPLTVLNLSKNNLSDKGMTHLSTCLRSLGSLEALILQHNNITDAGVEVLLMPNTYSPTMKKLDLSCNSLGTRAAFAIGRMFRAGFKCELDALYLGGRVGNRGWGDEFLRILVDLLCRKGARPIRVFSYPHASITADGVRAIASLVVCATKLETINISKNTLQEPLSRRFLRDALRVNKTLKEGFFGATGITRAERDSLEVGALCRSEITYYEKMVLAYEACKELNICGKLGHALEVVITNNWQAVKPPIFPVLEAYVATKEDMVVSSSSGGGEDEENKNDEKATPGTSSSSFVVPIPLVFLTSNMRLAESLTTALDKVDGICNYITTLKRGYFLSLDWLKENIEGFRMQGEQKAYLKKFQWRDMTATRRRNVMLAMLEKWTSISLAKIIVCVDGKIRKVKEKGAKSKKKSWSKPGKKAGKINVEVVAMSIEELHSSYIELADCLQYLIGVSFAIKLRYQEIQQRLLSGKQQFDTSKHGGAEGMAKQASKSTVIAGLLPYADLLGCASLYIHYIYVSGPEEVERVKKSIIAFQRDKKRQMDIAHKLAKKLANVGIKKTGARFRVLRQNERDERNAILGFDPQERADKAARLAAEERARAKVEEEEYQEQLRIRAEEEAGGAEESDFEDEDSEDEESEEEMEATGKGKIIVREPTRFLVPKRDMQKKYEGLYTEDLVADKGGTKNGITAFARANRNHIVNAYKLRLDMPAYEKKTTKVIPVDIIVEIEEERSNTLQPLSRIDSIRPYIRLQERIRHKKAMNKYVREEQVGAI